ncbi:hypothetical protein C789_1378 [Microcystis aeruginosa FACHB-905 = DIANCHI905]|nr:hypothetical protein C789_1378 [Microcystis aeruginosa FACHB-905 = DIANCHI905]
MLSKLWQPKFCHRLTLLIVGLTPHSTLKTPHTHAKLFAANPS